jgi:hypothetical protein
MAVGGLAQDFNNKLHDPKKGNADLRNVPNKTRPTCELFAHRRLHS